MIIDIHNTVNQYGILYTDPPWPQSKGGLRKCRPDQGRQLDYQTMSLEEIKELHQTVLTSLTEDQHNVFMWTIDKYLITAEQMLIELGYKLHARLVWDKTNGVAPAFTVRFAHEYLLWFYRPGKMLMPDKTTRGKYTTVLREPATIHSKKPVCTYEMLEDMFPGAKKLELFARAERSSWDAWGNEI